MPPPMRLSLEQMRHEDRAALAERPALPKPRRHLQEVAALPAAHAHHAWRRWRRPSLPSSSRFTTKASATCRSTSTPTWSASRSSPAARRAAMTLAGHFRARGIAVVLGGPHVTLAARGGDAARRCGLRRLCRGDLAAAHPRLRRRSDAAALRPGPRFRIDQPAVCAPRPARRAAFPDASGVRGDARLRARLRVLRGADRLGPQAVPEAGRPRGRGHPAGRQAPHHLHRPQPDFRPRLCDGAVRGAGAAEGALVRPRHQPDRPRPRADAADGEERLRRPADRAREHLRRQPARHPQALQRPLALSHLDRRPARARDQHAGLFRVRQRPRRPRRLRPHRGSSRSTLPSTCRALRSSPRSRARRCTRGSTAKAGSSARTGSSTTASTWCSSPSR